MRARAVVRSRCVERSEPRGVPVIDRSVRAVRIGEKGPDARRRGATTEAHSVCAAGRSDEATKQMGPYRRSSQTSYTFDVHDVGYFAYGGHDVLELLKVCDF